MTDDTCDIKLGNYVKMRFDKEDIYKVIRIHFDENDPTLCLYDLDDEDNLILYRIHREELTKLWMD